MNWKPRITARATLTSPVLPPKQMQLVEMEEAGCRHKGQRETQRTLSGDTDTICSDCGTVVFQDMEGVYGT